MSDYTNDEYDLTVGEQLFVRQALIENGCGAETPDELIDDNMACMRVLDFRKAFPKLTKNQINGYIASLQVKGVLYFEKRMPFDHDLYWVDNGYLKSLPRDLNFDDEPNLGCADTVSFMFGLNEPTV